MMDVLDIACPYCKAEPGAPCVTRASSGPGKTTSPHMIRHDELQRTEASNPRLKIERARLPKKLRYKVRAHGHVWCDHHCGLHDASIDAYDEDGYRLDGTPSPCNPNNWRRVYVETDDKGELF